MIPSASTNFLYLANCLPTKYPSFYKEMEKLLLEAGVQFDFLPHCKDVWAKDFMPIQVSENRFVQFVYNPDYLKSKTWLKTISNTSEICNEIGLKPILSDIVLDGGNVIQSKNKVFLCEKVFKENPHYSRKELIAELKRLFETEFIYFLPIQPRDVFGHADGMLRFLYENTVLINDYSKEKSSFQNAFFTAVHNTGLDYVEIPYNPYPNRRYDQANGVYINYLEMKKCIILPVFGLDEDEKVLRLFEKLFKNKIIKTIDCNEIGNEGGLLNCISWNIKKTKTVDEGFTIEQLVQRQEIRFGIEKLEEIERQISNIQMELLTNGNWQNMLNEVHPFILPLMIQKRLKYSDNENVESLSQLLKHINQTINNFNKHII